MAITYRNLTYDVVTGESIDEDFRRIMCPHCMSRGFYSLDQDQEAQQRSNLESLEHWDTFHPRPE